MNRRGDRLVDNKSVDRTTVEARRVRRLTCVPIGPQLAAELTNSPLLKHEMLLTTPLGARFCAPVAVALAAMTA